jgi:branched-chain amino acid transport system ATP-binding protein
MLDICEITAGYGEVLALHGVSLHVEKKEIYCIVGSNAAGKSTMLKTISCLMHPTSGTIEFEGQRIDPLPPHQVVELGIAHVPEGRRLFSRLTVMDNLLLGAYKRRSPEIREKTFEMIFDLFPMLGERKNQRVGTLSGGEQQMVAIGRGLMSQPRLLLLDEPSLGIMPLLKAKIFDTIKRLNQAGITILLVEQDVQEALEIADHGAIMQTGRIVAEGEAQDLLRSDLVRSAYLGT